MAPYLKNTSGQNTNFQNITGQNNSCQDQNTTGRLSMPGPDVRCGPISGDQHHSTPLCLFVDRYLLSISRQKDVNRQNRTLCFEMIRGKIVNRKKG